MLRLDSLSLDDGPGDRALEGEGSPLEAAWVLMYTSGSSGKPKGALLTHGQLHWNALNTTSGVSRTSMRPSATNGR